MLEIILLSGICILIFVDKEVIVVVNFLVIREGEFFVLVCRKGVDWLCICYIY